MLGGHLLCASKSEEEKRDSPDKLAYDRDGMPTGCGRECTEQSAYRPIDRSGGGCFSVHGGRGGLRGMRWKTHAR